MLDYKKLEQLIKELPNDQKVVLCGHENTDYDSICSTLAFTIFLNKIGKHAFMLLEEKDIEKLEWYGKSNYIIHSFEAEDKDYIFIQMDSNRKSRLGIYEKYFDAAIVKINIDHHENNKQEADYIFVEGEISSTSEIVYNLISRFDGMIDKEIAALLYAGIVSDTYCFLQRTTPSTMKIASELLKYNINGQYVIKSVCLDKSLEEVKILSDMLSKIKYDKFHYIIMDRHDELYKDVDYNVMFKKCVPTVQNIMGVKLLGMFLVELDNRISGEFRSNCDLEVDQLAVELGGGGHKKASGFTNNMTLEQIMDITNQYISKNGGLD